MTTKKQRAWTAKLEELESKRGLTEEQKQLARELLNHRPPVLPGTRVCPDRKAQAKWFKLVTACMNATLTSPASAHAHEFCDIAGVPD